MLPGDALMTAPGLRREKPFDARHANATRMQTSDASGAMRSRTSEQRSCSADRTQNVRQLLRL